MKINENSMVYLKCITQFVCELNARQKDTGYGYTLFICPSPIISDRIDIHINKLDSSGFIEDSKPTYVVTDPEISNDNLSKTVGWLVKEMTE